MHSSPSPLRSSSLAAWRTEITQIAETHQEDKQTGGGTHSGLPQPTFKILCKIGLFRGPLLRKDELILVIRLGTPVPKEETASSSRPSVGRMSLRRAHAQLLSEGGDLSISQFALEICTNIS